MDTRRHAYGYYHVTLSAERTTALMRTNNERAFIVAQLQYFLSPRLILGDVPAHKQLASCIDLLSFSIKNDAIELILFSIDISLCRYLVSCISDQLSQYQAELRPSNSSMPGPYIQTSIRKLDGPHDALANSLTLHLRHEDWEYDRYSSIGFYLHDRRGDWMRTWRLSQLYENKPEHYLGLIYHKLHTAASVSSGASHCFAQ